MASKSANESIPMNPNWSVSQRAFFYRIRDALPILMGYLGTEIPVLDNHSNAQIVDETGVLKAVKKTAESAEKAHVERLKVKMGDADTMRGETYEAQYRGGGRVILNQGACKDLIEKADNLEVHLGRLLAAIESKQVTIPNNVFLRDEETSDDGLVIPPESNHPDFFTSAAGGRSLYVVGIS